MGGSGVGTLGQIKYAGGWVRISGGGGIGNINKTKRKALFGNEIQFLQIFTCQNYDITFE